MILPAVAGLVTIAKAVGMAAVKAVITMAAIIYEGRTLLRPIYRRVADTHNAEIFAATTLLVVLATSLLTQIAGLSLALGAFLVGDSDSGRGSCLCRLHLTSSEVWEVVA